MNSDHVTIEKVRLEVGDGPWWFAHDYPERPPDNWTVWVWDCDACFIHLQASAHLAPDAGGCSIVDLDSFTHNHTNLESYRAAVEWRRRTRSEEALT